MPSNCGLSTMFGHDAVNAGFMPVARRLRPDCGMPNRDACLVVLWSCWLCLLAHSITARFVVLLVCFAFFSVGR
jgi:hypothetical protein